jgi:hypothetical protein
MTTIARDASKPDAKGCGCRVDINIASQGDVNIYNCAAPGGGGPPAPPPAECPPAPQATGACVPLALGAKPKQSRQRKLQKLLANNRVPSALAASFFHMSRRFLEGRAPANPLEESAFGVLRGLPPELKGVLSCAVSSLDTLGGADRDRLFDPSLPRDTSAPIDPGALAVAVGEEIAQRVGELMLGEPGAVEQERPGKNRFFDPTGGETFEVQLRISRVNGLRTNEFRPALGPGDYEPAELQQHCEPVLVGQEVQLVCEVRRGNCPGNFLSDGTCLRVPDVEAGQAVVLEGVNYISVDATVRLTAQAPGSATREVPAHVVGDIETPLTEVVNGVTLPIRDSRVKDRVVFRVPEDLAPGVYALQIVMPNVSGIPALGNPILSNPQYLNVVPPATARFQIASETLRAHKETSPASFGSDEVSIRVIAVPLLPDLTSGSVQEANFRFGDVDSGEQRDMTRALFTHQENIAGVAISVVGFEIDSEDAFKNQIDSFSGAFVDIIKKEWDFIKATLAAAGGYQALKGLGVKGFIALGIAAAVTLAIDVFVALWAPADLIVEDTIGLSAIDLAAVTSANLPPPSSESNTTSGGIKVTAEPLDKRPQQLRERREYVSDDEESRYEIVLRYNRVA